MVFPIHRLLHKWLLYHFAVDYDRISVFAQYDFPSSRHLVFLSRPFPSFRDHHLTPLILIFRFMPRQDQAEISSDTPSQLPRHLRTAVSAHLGSFRGRHTDMVEDREYQASVPE